MRIREKNLSYYGVDEVTAKKLRQKCQSATPEEKAVIFQCCQEARADLCDHLFYSLVNGVGYDGLSRSVYIPTTKCDFYGWQRKALSLIAEKLEKLKTL